MPCPASPALSLPREKDNAFGPFPLHSNLSGSGFTKQAGQSKTIATLGVKSTVSRKKGIFRFAKTNINTHAVTGPGITTKYINVARLRAADSHPTRLRQRAQRPPAARPTRALWIPRGAAATTAEQAINPVRGWDVAELGREYCAGWQCAAEQCRETGQGDPADESGWDPAGC